MFYLFSIKEGKCYNVPSGGENVTWELELLLGIQNFSLYEVLSYIMIFFTKLGDYGFIWLLMIAYLGVFKKEKKKALVLLFALIGVSLIGNIVLKNIFMRPRPFVTYPYIDLLIQAPSGYSFPSGHSSSSFMMAYMLSYFYPKQRKWFWCLACVIAISRMFLFVHFPTDILAGAVLGIGLGYFMICLDQNQWFSKFD